MRNKRNMRKLFHFSSFRCAARLLRKSMHIKIHKYMYGYIERKCALKRDSRDSPDSSRSNKQQQHSAWTFADAAAFV